MPVHLYCVRDLNAVREERDYFKAEHDRLREALRRIASSYGSGASPYRLARQALAAGPKGGE